MGDGAKFEDPLQVLGQVMSVLSSLRRRHELLGEWEDACEPHSVRDPLEGVLLS